MSEFAKLSPEKGSLESRLQHMQSVQQQLMIERAHRMPLLANGHGLRLDQREELLIKQLADYCCHLRYQGLSNADQLKMARLAAGTLPAEVLGRFRGRIAGDDPARFALYSAHDNTILALLAHLGFRDAPVPLFAAYVVFELHASGDAAAKPFVRVAYNHDPSRVQVDAQQYLRLPGGKDIVDLPAAVTTAQESSLDLAAFEKGLMEARGSFESEAAWRAASDGVAPKADKKEKKEKKEKKGKDKEEKEGKKDQGREMAALAEQLATAQKRVAHLEQQAEKGSRACIVS